MHKHKDKIKNILSSDEYKEKRNKRSKERYKNDERYKLEILLRCQFRQALALQSEAKRNSVIELLGCSVNQLVDYISLKFKEGMSWDNHGEWHIDHIRPCASFDLSIIKEQKICFHYTNLQPLWKEDNLKKSSIYDGIYHRNLK